MKRTATIGLLAFASIFLASIATASDPISIQIHYQVGQSSDYQFTAHIEGERSVDVSAEVSQLVVKVYDDGRADIITSVGNPQIKVMGRVTRLNPPSPSFGRYDTSGRLLTNTTALPVVGFDMVELLALRPQQPMAIGESASLKLGGLKSLRRRATGSLNLNGVQSGIAQFSGDIQMSYPGQLRPVPMAISAGFDVTSGAMVSLEGQLSHLKMAGLSGETTTKFSLLKH